MPQDLPPTVPVGFVGLGAMGGPMAARLLSAGVALVVHNRDRSRAEPHLAAGATWANSPRAVGRAASGGVVFVMVTDARAVRAVLFGRSGVSAGAGPGTLIVNLSTIAPDESRAIAERLRPRGVRYLEAPVGGSLDAAAAGELLVFAGGDEADVAAARPLLERLSRRIELLGPVGQGAAMKLVNNLVMVATLAVDAEALAFAEALGLDTARVVELLLAGAGESRVLSTKKDSLLRGQYPARFKLSLATKDLHLVARTARDVGVPARIAREATRLADEGLRAGLGEQDYAVVLEAARGRRDRARAGSAAPPGPPPG